MRKPIALTLAAIVLIAVIVVGVVVGVKALSGSGSTAAGPECTVPLVGSSASGSAASSVTTDPTVAVPVYLTAAQLQNASTINAVGLSRGLPQQARIIALATAFQESTLRNLPNGDRDSVGLFQQRPSQGWGRATQILDPVYASGKFYDALLEVTGWQTMSLTKAAQAVQFSGFPDAYAKWEGEAKTLAAALGGTAPLELSCIAGALAPSADAPARKALAGSSSAGPALASALSAAQAELGGLRVVAITGSTATVTIAVRGVQAGQAGRALAAWAVAHGTGFAVTGVTVDNRTWTDHAWGPATSTAPAGRVSITTG
ncbi:hypothetical protein ABIB25_003789 [Nakamurella sp. UYEF19]|uniref:hypothetical protein n=1 Tax=Nakamurella sp. UYEF19 TaxID=1756392 RepID=UPI003395DBAB